jgi:hypothetical protein
MDIHKCLTRFGDITSYLYSSREMPNKKDEEHIIKQLRMLYERRDEITDVAHLINSIQLILYYIYQKEKTLIHDLFKHVYLKNQTKSALLYEPVILSVLNTGLYNLELFEFMFDMIPEDIMRRMVYYHRADVNKTLKTFSKHVTTDAFERLKPRLSTLQAIVHDPSLTNY